MFRVSRNPHRGESIPILLPKHKYMVAPVDQLRETLQNYGSFYKAGTTVKYLFLIVCYIPSEVCYIYQVHRP